MSMQYGWQSFKAFKSDSSEWPIRIGVGDGALDEEPLVEKGFEAGGERRASNRAWTSARVVVIGARCCSVIPEKRVR